MSYFARLPEQFVPPLPLETELLNALYGAARQQHDDVEIAATPGEDVAIRATFIRWFLLGAIPASQIPIARVRITGATIDGVLVLRGARLIVRLCFQLCRFTAPIDLTEATVPGFELIGGAIPAIHADRLTVRGSLLIRAADPAGKDGTEIKIAGAIRLNGATIRGNFDMQGAHLGAELAEQRGYLAPLAVAPVYCSHDPATPEARLAAQRRPNAEDGTREPAIDGRAWVALEADGLSVDGHLRCVWPFHAKGELRLDGCRIGRNLDCAGARLENFGGYTLSAAGARIAGTAYFGSPFHEHADDSHHGRNPQFVSRGTARLDGARVEGDLDCSDGCFFATAFLTGWNTVSPFENDAYALRANGVEVGANARFAGRFIAHGNVTLLNARIGRDLDFTSARLEFAGGEALCCDGIAVAGLVMLLGGQRPFWTNGLLRFVLASIGQGIYAENVRFDRSGPPAPLTQHAFLTEDKRFAKFAVPSELWLTDPLWTAHDRKEIVRHACGIYADDAAITGSFIWRDVAGEPANGSPSYPFWLHLSGASAETVDDDIKSWAEPDRFDIANCRYRSLAGLFEGYRFDEGEDHPKAFASYVKSRLSLLDREYAPRRAERSSLKLGGLALPPRPRKACSRYEAIRRFKPQPYLQLARVLRIAGMDKEANKVLARLESNRTRYGGFYWPNRLLRGFTFGFLLNYGFGWPRPAIVLLIWASISSVAFQIARSQHLIEPTWHNKENLAAKPDRESNPPYVPFNAPIFALDTLVPLVNLDQKENWEVEPMSHHMVEAGTRPFSWRDYRTYSGLLSSAPDRLVGWLIIFNKFFGWLLTSLFAGGVTGLLRGGREPAELPGGE